MEELTLLLVTILLSCLAFYLVVSHTGLYRLSAPPSQSGLTRASRVLFVTAHPDDEAMFFGPVLLGLRRAGCQLFLLVLSPGRESGHTRKVELYHSAAHLGIPQSNIVLVRHTKASHKHRYLGSYKDGRNGSHIFYLCGHPCDCVPL